MSDFEFEGEIVNHSAVEEDPAAAFLAREQNELAGLEDDNVGPETATGSANDFQNDFVGHHSVSSEQPVNGGAPPREEPLKIRMWREEQLKMLQLKDAEEEQKRGELQEGGRRELDEWYARYSEQIEKAKLNNREESKNAEKEWVCGEREGGGVLEWERVARLCDFNPKAVRGGAKDTSRMRSIILQLKQNKAPPIVA